MKRSTMTRRAAVTGLALLALSACGGTDDEQSDNPAPAEEAPEDTTGAEDQEIAEASDGGGDEESDDEDDTEEDADAPAEEAGAEVRIGETFTDEETGDTLTIISALRDMPTERDAIYIEEGGEVVYLQLEVTPGDKFGGMISPLDLYIQYDGDEDRAKSVLNDELTAAGYEPFESHSRRDGPAGPFWVAFTVEAERQDTYTGVYLREEMKVLGEDTIIPEFRHEFEIPAA